MARRRYGKASKDRQQDRKIRQIARWARPELKTFETLHATNAIPGQSTNALVATNISAVVNGATAIDRIGSSIDVHAIEVRGSCLNPGTSTSQLQFLRIMIVQDKRYNGTAPQGGEVLKNYNTTDVSMGNAYSSWNTNFVAMRGSGKGGQIRVLYDHTCFLPSNLTTTSGTATQVQCPFMYKKFFKKPIKVQYDGATGETGQLFVLVFPGSDTTGNDNPYYGWTACIRFSDP